LRSAGNIAHTIFFVMKLIYRLPLLCLLFTICLTVNVTAQYDNSVIALKEKLKVLKTKPGYLRDTAYANAVTDLAYLYTSDYPDSALQILEGNAERCQATGYVKGEADTYIYTGDAYQAKGMNNEALENYEKASVLVRKMHNANSLSLIINRIGIIYLNRGNYPEALSRFYESLKAAEASGNKDLAGATWNNIAAVQYYQGKFSDAENSYRQRLRIAQEVTDTASISVAYNGLGEVELQQKRPSLALRNLELAYTLAAAINDHDLMLTAELSMGEAYYALDSLQKASELFDKALTLSRKASQNTAVCNALIGLAKTRHKQGLNQQALANGIEGLHLAEQMGQVQLMRDANEIVSIIYEASGEEKNALQHYKVYKQYSDSINSTASKRAVEIEKASYEFEKKETAFERKAMRQQWITMGTVAALILLTVIIWIINRNKKRLDHTYKELQKKNAIIEQQKQKAEATLLQLQATQAQLIQSEKMASLGELTAGIAHEIQNPLNFVNNFSEINGELIRELRSEAVNGNINEITAIVNDIESNSEKINHHGKRADAIVKGMLQHSRHSKGIKEPADINALCKEYLKLSYHGLRAKDKSFNADFTTVLDESIGKINIVPADMGRVLLNLFNNAFYAVNDKKKRLIKDVSGFENLTHPDTYEPAVSVATKKINDSIEITVKDNGNGIPQNIIDKIFQPFFTTKPTGQGTGLGLSLAYDIVTKEHNGTIKAESIPNEGTTFIILLPA
jgi:two-component system, NtrC family, sensor kinase